MFCLWIPHTVLNSANTVADSANSPIFQAILSGRMIYVFVCGIQNSIDDPRKVASCEFRDKSDFGLLRTSLTMQRMHNFAS